MELSIILPAYLEEENLNLLLPRIKDVAGQISSNHEILVVDTMSAMDGTEAVVKKYGGIYLNRQGGNNYGDAVRTGIQKATGKWIVFMDADGSHFPEFIKNLYAQRIEGGVVVASRYVEGGGTENSKILILMSKIVNIGYSLVLNIRCKDVSNSFKLYSSELLKSLELRCDNFDIVEEILCKIMRRHPRTKIKELPFVFKKRMFGETKRNLPLFVFTYITTLLKLRFMR